jgi:hypothetical protein
VARRTKKETTEAETGGQKMSKRKYRKGEKITSLDELAKQEFIYFFDKITHCGWFMSWQFILAEMYIRRGWLYYAVKIEEEDNEQREAD